MDIGRPGDRLYADSPDVGDDCYCSRCGAEIVGNVVPVRAMTSDGLGEYRYHPACLGMRGVDDDAEDDDDPF